MIPDMLGSPDITDKCMPLILVANPEDEVTISS